MGTPTVTAKNGTSIWGTAPLTMTVGPPATTSLNAGSGQSTLVNTGFTNPLVTTVTDAFGNPVSGVSVTFSAPASGASGSFGTCSGGNPQTYQCVVTTTASGQASAPALTANTKSGNYSISAVASGTNTVNFAATNTAASAAQVTITPNPDPSSASSVTSTALGFQLVDLYGNNTTASTGGISLTLSTSSTKGVFSASNNATGSATATISFASGAGTATEYYGDQAAGSPTITAKKLTATWGTASPTITAKTTGDTMTIVAGNGQSAVAGATFTTPLTVQDVDQYGNPVSGVSVTFSAPASGASGSFGTCSGGNPQTYQCVVTTTASGQASTAGLDGQHQVGQHLQRDHLGFGRHEPPDVLRNQHGRFTRPGLHHAHPQHVQRIVGHQHCAGLSARRSVRQQRHGRHRRHLARLEHQLDQGRLLHLQQRHGQRHGDDLLRQRCRDGDGVLRGPGAGSPTITAKVGTTVWGTASPTITAKTTGDAMTIVAGNGQSRGGGCDVHHSPRRSRRRPVWQPRARGSA